MNDSDEERETIARVLRGDRDAFRELVLQHQDSLWRFVGNLIADPHTQEDIAQDAFLIAYRRLPSFRPERARFRTWLFTIAKNLALNAREKRNPQTGTPLPEQELRRTPDRDIAESEFICELDRALEALPWDQKTAFILSELHDWSHQEIALMEEVPIGTVKTRIHRARVKLRSMLKEKAG